MNPKTWTSFPPLCITRKYSGDFMAKINKIVKNNQISEGAEEKSPGFFQKLFAWVIIPLLFVVAILLVIAQFTNTNVFEKASEVLPFDKKDASPSNTKEIDEEILLLKAEIKEKDAEIEKLQRELDDAIAEKENQIAIQKDLRRKIEELESGKLETRKDLKEIVKTYENMSAKAVAPIIAELGDEQALEILSNMKPDKLSQVLAKMEPKDAARYTELLAAKKTMEPES